MNKSGKSRESIEDYIEVRKNQINKELNRLLLPPPNGKKYTILTKSLKHTVLLKGKRLRPIFTLAVYELFKTDTSKIFSLASAIELAHAGSLMLDDLPCMDDAEYRRGEKTNHILYGESVTILAATALWVQVFEIIASIEDVKINDLIKETANGIGKNGLILGQYMDLFAFNKKQSVDELLQCYILKTSSLFRLAVKYGATLGGANNKEVAALERFGKSFGLAYQIYDDILDATLSEEETGKDANKDSENNKPNFVSLLGLEQAKKELDEETKKALMELESIDRDTSRLKELVNYVLAK